MSFTVIVSVTWVWPPEFTAVTTYPVGVEATTPGVPERTHAVLRVNPVGSEDCWSRR